MNSSGDGTMTISGWTILRGLANDTTRDDSVTEATSTVLTTSHMVGVGAGVGVPLLLALPVAVMMIVRKYRRLSTLATKIVPGTPDDELTSPVSENSKQSLSFIAYRPYRPPLTKLGVL